MHFNVKLLSVTRSEKELGQIARFCHTPVGTSLDEEGSDYEAIAVRCFQRKHMSVFEFADLLYDVTCPIYVARQLFRHRNGTFMEKSLRHLKPMTLDEYNAYTSDDDQFDPFHDYRNVYADALKIYKELIEAGERKERARAVLPLGTPTEFLWRISLRSLFNVFDQRLGKTAQEETRTVVKSMFDLAFEKFPAILRSWQEEKNGARL